jgi:adenylate cyclase
MIDTLPLPALPMNFDAPVWERIVDVHVWAVRKGLQGTEPTALFASLCQRLIDAGVPVWRAFAGARTLHPQCAACATSV